ncbi:MAG: hypothetical protein JW913_19635 [Chitinispirillaceae bacterium]|nr:hypothetical protein [Chitinispirillaceae bacterium]
MRCEPDFDLIEKMHRVGLSRRELVEELCRPYGTISTWLRGFAPMPPGYRNQIIKLIAEREQASAVEQR